MVVSHSTVQQKRKAGGLFSGYIDLFLKLKQEASRYSISCSTEDAKDRYIRENFEKGSILLEKDNIIPKVTLKELLFLQIVNFKILCLINIL